MEQRKKSKTKRGNCPKDRKGIYVICQISKPRYAKEKTKKKKRREEKENEGYTTTRLGSIQIYGPDSRQLRT